MGHWPVHRRRTGQTEELANRSGILTSTSGNVQSFAADSKSYLGFREQCVNPTRAISEPHYPLPSATLKSNDTEVNHPGISRNKSRRSSLPRYRPLSERSYLNNEKYLTYRSRKRFDKGDDGKPVWSDDVEESFQNALIHIPPMGKKKKTQHGKLFGRNELIKEWIFQETGEVRGRKQISSHIQVLNTLLKDDPEWRAVVVHDGEDDNEDDDATTNDGPDFYFHSIADQVRLQRDLQAQAKREVEEKTTNLSFLTNQCSMSKISFEMWVGMPERITQSLHNYTRISNTRSIRPTIPLDDCNNWTALFPDLESILKSSANEQFDIVLVKSKISLMQDFPPLASKLGLVLDLDFRGRDNPPPAANLKHFSSVNHMYLNGELFGRKEHKDCRTTEPGVLKPVFEAEWWAAQFTELTHMMKEAEASKNEAAVINADEYSRTLFRGLTMMQEVLVPLHANDDPLSSQQRIAIILWIFARATEGHDGVTTWQKVSLPRNDQHVVSPTLGKEEASLPPLELGNIFESTFQSQSIEDKFDNVKDQAEELISPASYKSCSYHSGFTPLHHMGEDHSTAFDFSIGTGFTPRPQFPEDVKQEQTDSAMDMDAVPPFQQPVVESLENQHIAIVAKDSPSTTYEEPSTTTATYYNVPGSAFIDEPPRVLSLANFDVRTHQVLQEQLGNFDDAYQEHELPHEFDSQQSTAEHMNSLGLESDLQDHTVTMVSDINPIAFEYAKVLADHPTIFDSPKCVRPPLIAHNSFAGVLHTSEPREQQALDVSIQHDFALLISNHFDHLYENSAFDSIQPMIEHLGMSIDHQRPRSQPVLPSNGTDRYGISDTTLSIEDGTCVEVNMTDS